MVHKLIEDYGISQVYLESYNMDILLLLTPMKFIYVVMYMHKVMKNV